MYKHVAKRHFGQNFLKNQSVISQIIQIINPQNNDFIIEIGPGLGALSRPLLEHVQTLNVIEIDRDIVAYLYKAFDNNLIIHQADALKFDYTFNHQPTRVIGNLPYNISTPLLFHLAQFDNVIDMHFMLQREVVERICAEPNRHAYGKLSVMLQYRFDCVKMLDVGRENFDPKPKVESAIVQITPKSKDLWDNVNNQILNQIVSTAFNQRRKTIANSLSSLINKDRLQELGFDPQMRAENLTVQDYVNLSKYYTQFSSFCENKTETKSKHSEIES